jgi:hypothetical protein
MQKVKELVNLPYFEFDDVVLCVKNMEVQKSSMTLLVDARVTQIPPTQGNF